MKSTGRKPTHPINRLMLDRWSPRAMTGEAIPESELMGLFEAARWAPSSGNNQPWRFIYALRDSPDWPVFFDLLMEGNRRWCKDAAVLIVVVSKLKSDDGKRDLRTHSFDAGAAWENLALEGASRGLVVHGMSGFDYDKAKEALQVPDGFSVEAMAAVGKLAAKDVLPADLQERELPSGRKPLEELVMRGRFRM